MKIIAKNQRAFFDYEILEKFEAGLVLKGYETKSIKNGRISLKGTFVNFYQNNEPYLVGANIPLLKQFANAEIHSGSRSIKLLLTKKEISRIKGKISEKGLTTVPLSVYIKGKLVKAQIALAKGKKQFDKRQTIKNRQEKIHIDRFLKSHLGR